MQGHFEALFFNRRRAFPKKIRSQVPNTMCTDASRLVSFIPKIFVLKIFTFLQIFLSKKDHLLITTLGALAHCTCCGKKEKDGAVVYAYKKGGTSFVLN